MPSQARFSLAIREGEAICGSNFASVPDFGSIRAFRLAEESTVNPSTIWKLCPKVKIASRAPVERRYFTIWGRIVDNELQRNCLGHDPIKTYLWGPSSLAPRKIKPKLSPLECGSNRSLVPNYRFPARVRGNPDSDPSHSQSGGFVHLFVHRLVPLRLRLYSCTARLR